MKAIITKYLGPTNTKGSRIKASVEYGRKGPLTVTVPYDNGAKDPHEVAAWALIDKWKAAGGYIDPDTLVSGVLPNGGTVFCFPESIVTRDK